MAVFMSYSHQDASVVERLALMLLGQNVKVWRDVWRNAVGEDFVTGVRGALAGASSACIFVSSHSLKSAWVTDETRMAIERATQDPDFLVIPIRLDDSGLPSTLQGRVAVDCRHDHEAALRQILAAIQTVENKPPKGRLKLEGSYYIHFGIEECRTSDSYTMQVDVISFDLEETFSVLSQFEFRISGEEPWTRLGLDQPEAIRACLLRLCAREFATNPAVVKLSARDVKRARFTIADGDGQPQVDVNVRVTTLGSGPSGSLVFNGGTLFEQVCRASGIPLDLYEAEV